MKKNIILIILVVLISVNYSIAQQPLNDSLQFNSNTEILQQSSINNNFEIETQRLLKNIFLIAFIFMIFVVFMIFFIYHNKIKEVIQLVKIQERELELKKFEVKKLGMILNYTENSIALTDKTGKILWANNGFTSLFGKTYEELEISNNSNIFTDLTEKNIKVLDDCRTKKEPVMYSSDFSDDFGSKVWYQRHLIPILDEKNEIINFAAIDSDLTAVKLAMEQVNIQKKKVEDQKQKITDSINYASYIQAAVLPPFDYIYQILPQHFILYKPRDIVSGDFYWVKKIDASVFVVAADCTGHGVPGAFMSMLGVSFLNEIIRYSDIKPNEILNKLRDNVMTALHQTGKEGEQKDGMDISICVINELENKLQFAGANNPLYFISNANGKDELKIYKADNMPIGIYYKTSNKFTNHEVEIKKGDSFYIFSDGFADQFGGEEGRKFLQKRFRELIFEVHDKPMSIQKNILDKSIDDWMSFKDKKHNHKFEQLDDILVFGVKI